MRTTMTRAGKFTAKGRATREHILIVASELMRTHGVANTSTEDIQVAAGVSASQLYHYFHDKGDLIRAVIAYHSDAMFTEHDGVETHLDSLEALRAWRDQVVNLQREHDYAGGCPLGSFTSQVAEKWPEARAEIAAGFLRWEHNLRSGLEAMQRRGELGLEAQPDRLARAALAAVQGGMVLTQAQRNTLALEGALDEFIARIESLSTAGIAHVPVAKCAQETSTLER